MISLLVFIVVLGVIILIHEFGHFIAAKTSGVNVEKFSLGFGKKIFSFKREETEYAISMFPLGGYVKLAGDTANEAKGEKFEYLSKPIGVRAKIIFAGSFFNYLLAFVCFWLVFVIGYPTLTTKVGEVLKDYPAYSSGLKAGDEVIEIDGKKVDNWDSMQREIQVKQGIIKIKVRRDSQIMDFAINPQKKDITDVLGSKKKISLIGIAPKDEFIKQRYNPIKSIFVAAKTLIDFTVLTYKSLWRMVVGKMSFKESVTGPLGIFYITKKAASFGISAVLHLMAVLNLSLAVFNLLPLPVFDGGHIVLLGIEKLRRRKFPVKFEEIMNNVGWGFIIILAVFVFFNDLVKFGILKNIHNFIK